MPIATSFTPCFAIGGIGWTELVVIMFVLLLLFGGSQLPKLAKSVGQSIVEFKKGVRDNDSDDEDDKKDSKKQLKDE